MTLPTVHLNGTSAEVLFETYRNAWNKVQEARAALFAVEFHPRDYYPQGEEAFKKAREEMGQRMDALELVAGDLEKIAVHVMQFVKETK